MAEPMTEEEIQRLREYLEPLSLGTGGFAYETDNRLARLLATLDEERGEANGAAIDAGRVLVLAERYRAGLEKIRELMSPGNRHAFVSRGPMAFASVYNVVEDALAGKEQAQ
jgi:hypothetical protein